MRKFKTEKFVSAKPSASPNPRPLDTYFLSLLHLQPSLSRSRFISRGNPVFTCIIGQTSFPPVIPFSRRSRRSHDSIFPQFQRGISIKLLNPARDGISPPYTVVYAMRDEKKSTKKREKERKREKDTTRHSPSIAWIHTQ